MIGSVFEGRYSVNGFLSEGPVFMLFSARDRLTGRDISFRLIKSPFDLEGEFKEAIRGAIDRLVLLQSQYVERLMDLQEDDGKVYIIGELTRAPSLSDRIRKLAPFTPPVAVASAIAIARGLESFHKFGFAHGDLSGENVAMLGDGETRLQMGGIWSAYSRSATAGVLVLPSLAPYLAPEVSNGELPDAKSDLYSAGILLYELLTGRRPYQADSGLATAMRHSTETTPRVRSLNPSIPPVLDEIVYKAMSKDPGARYGTAGELIFDLRQTQDALRFGRNLSWPITPPADSVPVPRKPLVAQKPTRTASSPVSASPREKQERDVPVWMLLILVAGVGAIVALGMVMFVIGATSPRLVPVPNLSGMTVQEAKSSLSPMHLRVKIGSTAASSRIAADRIISSDPPTGQKLPENSTISVNLSLGSKEVPVPQLRTLTPDKAREVLSTVNLGLDDNFQKLSDPGVPEGAICKQSPAAGVMMPRDGKVHVAVNTAGAPANSAEAQHFIYTINTTLSNVLEPTEVRMDITDDNGTRTFFDETHEPGDAIHTTTRGTGAQATFTIYYNGKQVEQKIQNASESAR